MKADRTTTGPLVTAPRRPGQPLPAVSPDTLSPMLIAIGIVMAIAGWLDIALAYVPLQFGNGEWEFATISRTFDGMALGTLGLGFVAIGAVRRENTELIGVIATVLTVLTAGLFALAALYALNVPVALVAAQGPLRSLLMLAIFRTTTFVGAYLVLYVWLSWYCWRQFRALRALG